MLLSGRRVFWDRPRANLQTNVCGQVSSLEGLQTERVLNYDEAAMMSRTLCRTYEGMVIDTAARYQASGAGAWDRRAHISPCQPRQLQPQQQGTSWTCSLDGNYGRC